jgi:hypothetical protein
MGEYDRYEEKAAVEFGREFKDCLELEEWLQDNPNATFAANTFGRGHMIFADEKRAREDMHQWLMQWYSFDGVKSVQVCPSVNDTNYANTLYIWLPEDRDELLSLMMFVSQHDISEIDVYDKVWLRLYFD